MKRKGCSALILLFSAALAAQDIGSAWINVRAPFFTSFRNALQVGGPMSFLAKVSSGIFRDEIDMVLRNPLQLGDYSGWTAWTAWGNYEVPSIGRDNPAALAAGVNPFGTVALNNNNVGNFQLGLGMPLPLGSASRLGILGGRQYLVSNLIDDPNGTGQLSTYEWTDLFVHDDDSDARAGATERWASSVMDETTTDTWRLAAGADLGSLGISLYAFGNTAFRRAGGSYAYTWTVGNDLDDAGILSDVLTGERANYGASALGTNPAGSDSKGEAAPWANGSTGAFGGIVQLPFAIGGLSLPLSARLGLDFFSGSLGTAMPARYFRDRAYVVDNNANEVSHYAWTDSRSIATEWNDNASSAPVPAFQWEPAAVLDVGASGSGSFAANLDAAVDPVLPPSGPLTLKPRLALSYALGFEDAGTRHVAYSRADLATAAAENDLWEYSSVKEAARFGVTNRIGLELGALGLFANEARSLELGLGLYARPRLNLASVDRGEELTTVSRSWSDENAAGTDDPTLADVLTAIGTGGLSGGAAVIGPGALFEGSSVYTGKRTWAENDQENEVGIAFSVPVSARLSFIGGKIQLVAGYLIEHDASTVWKYSSEPDLVETLVVKDSAGAAVYGNGNPTSAVTGGSSSGSWDVARSQVWTGSMGFLLRIVPTRNFCIDFDGNALMANLQGSLGDIVSFNGGLIQFTRIVPFLQNLTMSVTFRF